MNSFLNSIVRGWIAFLVKREELLIDFVTHPVLSDVRAHPVCLGVVLVDYLSVLGLLKTGDL